MSQFQQPIPTLPNQPFRLDVPLHNLLQQHQRNLPERAGPGKTLPEPVFPQYPELLHEIDEEDIAAHNVAYCYDAARVMKWLLKQARHGFQGVTGSFE